MKDIIVLWSRINAVRQKFWNLVIRWSDFHIGPCKGVVKPLPAIPDHTITKWHYASLEWTVQVRVVAVDVPPGVFIPLGIVYDDRYLDLWLIMVCHYGPLENHQQFLSNWTRRKHSYLFCSTRQGFTSKFWWACMHVTIYYNERFQSPRYPCPAAEQATRTFRGKRSAMTCAVQPRHV